MHLEILDKKRKLLLEKLGFTSKLGFFLAGGTSLALQLGHRTSVDFDFFSLKSFDQEKIFENLRNERVKFEVSFTEEDTLSLVTKDGIEVSFFKNNYPLLFPFKKLEKIDLASEQDISALKIGALLQRGTQRDFIDLYYLLRKYSVEQIINWAKEKYPHISVELMLMSMTYFKDANADQKSKARIKMLDKNFSWPKAKDYIEKKIFEYQRLSAER